MPANVVVGISCFFRHVAPGAISLYGYCALFFYCLLSLEEYAAKVFLVFFVSRRTFCRRQNIVCACVMCTFAFSGRPALCHRRGGSAVPRDRTRTATRWQSEAQEGSAACQGRHPHTTWLVVEVESCPQAEDAKKEEP